MHESKNSYSGESRRGTTKRSENAPKISLTHKVQKQYVCTLLGICSIWTIIISGVLLLFISDVYHQISIEVKRQVRPLSVFPGEIKVYMYVYGPLLAIFSTLYSGVSLFLTESGLFFLPSLLRFLLLSFFWVVDTRKRETFFAPLCTTYNIEYNTPSSQPPNHLLALSLQTSSLSHFFPLSHYKAITRKGPLSHLTYTALDYVHLPPTLITSFWKLVSH